MEGNMEIVEIINPTIPIKKETIFDKLNKRNKDRQNYLETKIENRTKLNEEEDSNYFNQTFTERIKKIDNKLANIKLTTKIELNIIFSEINNDIQDLQRYLSQSTMFLPDYNIKGFQNCLNELNNRTEELRLTLMPKKKFGFNRQKLIAPIKIIPKINFINKIDDIKIDEKIYFKDLNKKNFEWTLSKRKNDYILLIGDDVDGKDITMTNLENCLIEIQGHPGSIQISNSKNCILLSGPVARSLFAENIEYFNIVVACQQLRLHSSNYCKLWLHVTCRGIIEDCKNIEIGPYNYEYSGLDCDYKKSGLDQNINNYHDIADFNWLAPDKPSPNWKLMDNRNNLQNWDIIKENFKELNIKL